MFCQSMFLQWSWSPKEILTAPISSAIYSCDGLLVYASFYDGAVGVFYADSLRIRCRIAPSAYIPSFAARWANDTIIGSFPFSDSSWNQIPMLLRNHHTLFDVLKAWSVVHYLLTKIFCSSNPVYPLVVAAHPSEPNQIALGMSDGAVHVLEPFDIEQKWGGPSSQDNGPIPSNSSNPSPSGQASELPPRWWAA
jgi:hypothetical protein